MDMNVLFKCRSIFDKLTPGTWVSNNVLERQKVTDHLKNKGILSVFHYISLHKSSFNMKTLTIPNLPSADRITDCLLILPF